ncbi:hypothetical protein ACFYU8_15350 [Brevibacillus sp. NPDC003359]|uniref:hypothetical protein n=1 Tax=unclassified Brevibacillus TaxID=2684853 RepID=UPI0036C138E4
MDKIKQAQINGFLQAFALLNLHTNHGYTFEWNELEYHDDILTTFKYSFNLEGDKNLGEVRLIPLDDWSKVTKVILAFRQPWQDILFSFTNWDRELGPHRENLIEASVHGFHADVIYDPNQAIRRSSVVASPAGR